MSEGTICPNQNYGTHIRVCCPSPCFGAHSTKNIGTLGENGRVLPFRSVFAFDPTLPIGQGVKCTCNSPDCYHDCSVDDPKKE